jgi:hypothetical protein
MIDTFFLGFLRLLRTYVLAAPRTRNDELNNNKVLVSDQRFYGRFGLIRSGHIASKYGIVEELHTRDKKKKHFEISRLLCLWQLRRLVD